jgi:hypothetical protein
MSSYDPIRSCQHVGRNRQADLLGRLMDYGLLLILSAASFFDLLMLSL